MIIMLSVVNLSYNSLTAFSTVATLSETINITFSEQMPQSGKLFRVQ